MIAAAGTAAIVTTSAFLTAPAAPPEPLQAIALFAMGVWRQCHAERETLAPPAPTPAKRARILPAVKVD